MAEVASPPLVKKSQPDAHSSDYDACEPLWRKVSDVLAGVEAMRRVSYGGQVGGPAIPLQNVPDQQFSQGRGIEIESPYLPRFPNETYADYDRRRRNAFLTNVYADISSSLASKPFAKTCELAEDSPPHLVDLSENVDGLGNNLHVFSAELFRDALDRGISWILVDYTRVPPGATAADERTLGARPYWIHVRPEQLIAVYSHFVRGQEIVYHARVEECSAILEGYDEKQVRRVRVFEREPQKDATGEISDYGDATWKLLEEVRTEHGDKVDIDWVEVGSGRLAIGVIPLIPLILGKRENVTWRVAPPLRDLVYMQIKLFQMESNLDSIKELTAFPMLAANGISLTRGVTGADGVTTNVQVKVPVGPRGVLAAPPDGNGNHGQWSFIEPAGSSLTFLQSDIEKYETAMRELGMQPLTTANLTVVTTANVSVKVHSVSQKWSLALKDCLEQAWKVTAQWLRQTFEPTVLVHVPPPVRLGSESDKDWLLKAEGQGVISPQTTREQAKSLGVLSDDYDESLEDERLASHQEGQQLQPEKRIDPITGKSVVVQPKFGEISPPPKPVAPKPAALN